MYECLKSFVRIWKTRFKYKISRIKKAELNGNSQGCSVFLEAKNKVKHYSQGFINTSARAGKMEQEVALSKSNNSLNSLHN